MQETCHTMRSGEVLNVSHKEYPIYYAVLYGNRVDIAKLSKRLSCAIKHLPLRVKFSYEYDTSKAIEKGISKDPSLVLGREVLIEGLVHAEEITQAFEVMLLKKYEA